MIDLDVDFGGESVEKCKQFPSVSLSRFEERERENERRKKKKRRREEEKKKRRGRSRGCYFIFGIKSGEFRTEILW